MGREASSSSRDEAEQMWDHGHHNHEGHDHEGHDHENHSSHEHHDDGYRDHRMRDMYHGNPIPGAKRIPVEFVHGICHMESGTQDITGTVYMRQRFLGRSPVSMDFQLSGFDHSLGHMHNFTINRY